MGDMSEQAAETPEEEYERKLRDHNEEVRLHAHRMDVWKVEAPTRVQLFAAHVTAITGFANLAINSIILSNSAAAGAVLALIGTVWGKPEAKIVGVQALPAVLIFAIGVVTGMLSAASSYVSQFCHGSHDMTNDGHPWKKRFQAIGFVFQGIAVLLSLAGIVLFTVGMVRGLRALGLSDLGLPMMPGTK